MKIIVPLYILLGLNSIFTDTAVLFVLMSQRSCFYDLCTIRVFVMKTLIRHVDVCSFFCSYLFHFNTLLTCTYSVTEQYIIVSATWKCTFSLLDLIFFYFLFCYLCIYWKPYYVTTWIFNRKLVLGEYWNVLVTS